MIPKAWQMQANPIPDRPQDALKFLQNISYIESARLSRKVKPFKIRTP